MLCLICRYVFDAREFTLMGYTVFVLMLWAGAGEQEYKQMQRDISRIESQLSKVQNKLDDLARAVDGGTK